MKVKRIGTICKARKTCILYNEDNADGVIVRQWISCGAAMWPVSGLPMLQEKHLSSLFQFEAKQAKEMRIFEDLMPDTLREVLGDWEEWEADLQESSLIVAGEGMSLSMLSSGDKNLWINRDLLLPCWTGQTRIIRRESGLGPVAAVMDGMLISGIILPAQLPPDFYRELLRMGCSSPRPVTPPEEPPEEEDTDEDGGDEGP